LNTLPGKFFRKHFVAQIGNNYPACIFWKKLFRAAILSQNFSYLMYFNPKQLAAALLGKFSNHINAKMNF